MSVAYGITAAGAPSGTQFALPALLTVETVVLAVLAVATWRRRSDTPVAVPFGFVLVLFTVLVGTYGLQVITPTLDAKITLYKISQTAMILSPIPWFVFALHFTGRQHLVTPERVALGSTLHLALIISLWSDPLHGQYFTGFALSSAGHLVVGRGPLHWLTVWYDYLVIGAGVVLLTEMYVASQLHRRSITAILVGVLVPWFAHMAQFADVSMLSDLNLTAIAIVVTGIAWYLAIFRFDVLTLVPIAREQAFDALNDGILVVDQRGRIADANPAATTLLPDGDDLIGRDAVSVLSTAVDDPHRYLTGDGNRADETVALDRRTVHIDLQSIALESLRGRDAGYVLVLRDVTPVRERERQLKRQNERLEEFASIVSHDLRNPLNVAYGYAEVIEESGDPEYAGPLVDSLDRMDLIIEDVLTLAREGDDVRDPQPLALRRVAEDAWRNVETAAAGLEIDSSITLQADEGRLLQLLENLFRNAIQHTDDPTVRVGVLPSKDGFFVEDDGPGIPPEDRDRVLDSGVTTDEEGTGFGLAIVETISEAHGWHLVITESPDGGARFEFTGATAGESVPAVDGAANAD